MGVPSSPSRTGEASKSVVACCRDRHSRWLCQHRHIGARPSANKLTGTDDRGTAVDRSAQTDGSGGYLFAELRPGTYGLNEVQPVAKGKIRGGRFAQTLSPLVPTTSTDGLRCQVRDPSRLRSPDRASAEATPVRCRRTASATAAGRTPRHRNRRADATGKTSSQS